MTDSIDGERDVEPVQGSQEQVVRVGSHPRHVLSRLIAKLMTFAGWMGFGVSLLLFITMPFFLHRMNTSLSVELMSLSVSLHAASDSLAGQGKNIDLLDAALQNGAELSAEINESLTAVTPLLDDMAGFLGGELPLTLNSTERSLRSASEGAAAIDALLRILSRIPFIGSIDYDPRQPLDASLVEAADGLTPLSEPLVELQLDLNEFSLSLGDLQTEMTRSQASLAALSGKMAGIKDTIKIGSDRLASLAALIEDVADRLPGIAITLGILFGLSSVWVMLLNAVLIVQGRQWSARIDEA